jgi:hypothetical protein
MDSQSDLEAAVANRPVLVFLTALILLPLPAQGPSAERTHRGVTFVAPAGWSTSIEQDHLLLTPPVPNSQPAVIIMISGAEALGAQTFDDWFGARMAADLAFGLKALQAAPSTRGRSGSLDLLSAGRTVQDRSGGVILQIYHAISNGKQTALAMVATTSEAALKQHMPGVQTIFQSLRIAAADGAPATPSTSSRGAGAATPGSKTTLTAAQLVGSWGHSTASYTEYVNSSGSRRGSDTISVSNGYTFAADGTYDLSQTSMINSQFIKERDTGRWSLQGNVFMIRSSTGGRRPKDYFILSYQVAPDGTTFMSVLDTYYPPTKENIEMWTEKWVKRGKEPGAQQ